MARDFIMVRPTKRGNVMQELADLANLPEFHGNQSAVVREIIHEKWLSENKRVIMVQHHDGRIEVDPSAK